MLKKKYRFNPETLSYEQHGVSLKERLTRFFAYFSSSLAFSVVLVVFIINTYETPRAKAIKRENQRLQTQYKLMQKDLETIEKVLDDIQQRDDNIYRVIFETEPIPSSVRKAGFGGTNKYAHLENMDNADLVIATARKLDIIAKEAYIQSKSYDEVMKLALDKGKMLASIPAIQPISNADLKRTASGWGHRIHPVYKIRKFHYGMDFTAPIGTEIYATGDGVITDVGSSRVGYGNYIEVGHPTTKRSGVDCDSCTLEALVLSSSSAVAVDLLGTLRPGINEIKQMFIMRGFCVLFVALSYIFATMNISFIVNLMSFSWGVVAGCFIGPFLWGLYWKGVTKMGAWAGALSGLVTVTGLTVSNTFQEGFAAAKSMAPQFGVTAMIVSLAAVPIVSLFTKKFSRDHIDRCFKDGEKDNGSYRQ